MRAVQRNLQKLFWGVLAELKKTFTFAHHFVNKKRVKISS